MAIKLTDAQSRALLWLTPGKACGDNTNRSVSAALNSLSLFHPELVTSEYRETPRGRRYLGYELTAIGEAERAIILSGHREGSAGRHIA